MAEFDSGGLSAVSAFFGVKNDETKPPTKESSKSHSFSRGRHGVGSTVSRTKETKPDDTIGRVLKVGKRKRHDDEDDDAETASNDSDHELDEEQGRTGIAQEKRATAPIEEKVHSKKKKKKGKRERQAAAGKPSSDHPSDGTNNEKADEIITQTDTQQGDDTAVQQKAKRKRRKVRSRQKNIYKDKRLTQHKPGHLIPGRAEYQGRPMTTETRAKLNLPPHKSSRQESDENEDTGMAEQLQSGEGVKLAIDDLLGDESGGSRRHDIELEAMGSAQPVKRREKKTKKKKKRSKYKNLQ